MTPVFTGVVCIIIFFMLIFLNMPIAISMALIGFIGFSYLVSPSAAFVVVAKDIFSTFSSYSFSVIPMFVWMGFLAYYSGIGSRLYSVANKLVGHLPGGLAITTQMASALFGAICGSSAATVATIGAIAMPEMKKFKYNESLSAACVASGGCLGVLIPPSVVLIIYGTITEQSIGKLFLAGIIPGILLMIANIVTIIILFRYNPNLGISGNRASWKDRIYEIRGGGLLEILIIFTISLGGLFAGLFTPTEAGAIGAGGTLIITTLFRKLSWDGFKNSLKDTTRTTAMIILLIAGAIIFGRLITISEISSILAGWIVNLSLPPFLINVIILALYLLLGCFIDAMALILLTVPVFLPLVVILGYDPIWFGVMIVLYTGLGALTPPVGMSIYIIKGIAGDIPLETIFKGVWPFLISLIAVSIIFILFPTIITFLPNML